ncbi:MAG: helix-turn-helix transcriptional regulator [Thioploca sp.]|nr:helix-turn-helix transcriptional regulator [Thioploca sp.]
MLFLKQKHVKRQTSNVKRQTSNENSVNTLTPLSSVITKIILVIDDDVYTDFNLIINILNKLGLEVIVAHGAQEELIKTQVLSNITLPDVNQLIHEQEILIGVTTPPETDQLFRQIAEYLAVSEPTSSRSQPLATAHLPFVYKARNLLLAHRQDPPSLKQLAHTVGTNHTKLSKAFQQTFGMTVFAYLRECRLAKAQCLLHQSIFSIQQIADTIGYQNHSAFTATFRQRFGLTPRQYRQTLNCDANDRN